MIFSFGTGDAFSKLALEKWTALGTEDNDDDDGDDDGNDFFGRLIRQIGG